MSLTAGERLGPYEIAGFVGAGGMGEVYSATDTRLNRRIAIKILPAGDSAHAGRRDRFELEGRAISSLNHPHICSLYDVGEHAGGRYLVMERLEGETLAERLKRGPLPLSEALQIAIQVGEALDHAHGRRLLHRDLKPNNIMLTGAKGIFVKLLDFGLAKMIPRPAPFAGDDAGCTSTEPLPLTADGTLIGTVQYMAPEQLEGKEASVRTDIFTFGVVLYEMITGRKAFEGNSPATLIAAILKDDPPPVSAVRPTSSPALDRTVRKCLAKDPEDRWQSAHDLVDELKWIVESGVATGEAQGAGTKRRLAAWPAVTAVVIAAALLAAAIVLLANHARPLTLPAQTRFEVRLPEKATLGGFDFPVLSPDGASVVTSANTGDGRRELLIRRLDSLDIRALPGTDGANFPFWSPDSRWVAFFASGKLKKVDITGGSPVVLADAASGIGGSWNRDGAILFCPKLDSALQRVNDSGGLPIAAARLDAVRHQTSQLFPEFLPDGRHFLLYGVSAGREDEFNAVYLGSLDSLDVAPLFRTMGRVMYAEPGDLVFSRSDRLMAQAFDTRRFRLTGQPRLIVEGVGNVSAVIGSAFSVANGTLAYRAAANRLPVLTWMNRKGNGLANVPATGEFGDPALSPDGKIVAADYRESSGQRRSLWLLDSARGSKSRLTFDAGSDEFNPSWSPDGKRIAFTSTSHGLRDLYEKSADGTGPERIVLESAQSKNLEDWSRDGRFLLFNTRVAGQPMEVWALPWSRDRKPFRVAAARDNCEQGQFSPDGKWVAYRSFETGQGEIFVQDFPPSGGRWQVSPAGGSEPQWRRDGKELFYLEAGRLMALDIGATGHTFEAGIPHPLFDVRLQRSGRNSYVVSPDGEKFLMNVAPAESSATGFFLVTGWNGLKR